MRRNAALGLLSLASGGVGALSFLALGVFTSPMSGNAVLLGIALGQGRLSDASRSLLAFAGYAAGVVAAAMGGSWTPRRVLLAEAVLLGGFATLWPLLVETIHFPLALSPTSFPALILLAGAAMGMQARAARRLNAPGINTVVFTSTLTDIVAALTAALLGRTQRKIEAKTWQQIGAFLLFIAGAGALGALATHDLAVAAVPAFACVLLAAMLT